MLSSLQAAERQRLNATEDSISRNNNVDIVLLPDGSEQPFCHMIGMHSYWEVLGLGPISLAATALALEHLNSGNGVIVPQLAGLNDRCATKFTMEHIDTEGDKLVALRSLLPILQREPAQSMPCAFLGNTFSEVSEATSSVTGIMGYPQVSVTSSAEVLERQSAHPLFARVGPSAPDRAAPLMEFLYTKLDVRYVAVIVSDTTAPLSFVSGMMKQERHYDDFREIRVVHVPSDATEVDYVRSVEDLKAIGFHFIVAALAPRDVSPLMEVATKRGLAGDGEHVWIYTTSTIAQLSADPVAYDSPLRAAIDGALYYNEKKQTPGHGNNDKYVVEIESLWDSSSDKEYLMSKLPRGQDAATSKPFQRGSSIYDPTDAVGAMIYDSAVLVGLSACAAGGSNFTGVEHFDRILDTGFVGASGNVSLNHDSRARDPSTMVFSMSNFIAERAGGNYTFKQVAVAEYSNAAWSTSTDMVFAGGSTVPPPDIPVLEVSYNYISTATHAAGYTMSAIVLLSSLSLAVWTLFQQRKESHVIRAAQPIFLHMICLGSFLMGLAIIPAGLDDRSEYVDFGCTATPWLLSLGWCITFSSLFSKTLRINKVFHNPRFRRVVVTVQDVIRPMIVMVILNVAILLAWSIWSPMRWQRMARAFDKYGRIVDSRGFCSSKYTTEFGVPLLSINIAALLFSNYQAFVARKIATEFAESEYIARSMSLILVVIFIGVPSAMIAGDDSSVFFFVFAGLVFVATMSILLFMFLPKIMSTFKQTTSARERVHSAIGSTLVSCTSGPQVTAECGAGVLEHPKVAEDHIRRLHTEVESLRTQLTARASTSTLGSSKPNAEV